MYLLWRDFGLSDVEILADVLKKRFSHVVVRHDYGWPNSTALSVLDCVLSLNRRYDSVVFPRVQAFSVGHPNITELAHLQTMFSQYKEVGQFSREKLNYNDVGREHTLRGVVEYMLATQAKHQGASERERLQAWARSVHPSDYRLVGVKGFGLSGFQYMRMLFGVQTTKPDVHVIRFVSETIGRPVNDITALSLLEQAAAKVNLPLREVDGAIWEAGARPGSTTVSPIVPPSVPPPNDQSGYEQDEENDDLPVVPLSAPVQQPPLSSAWWKFWRRKQ